MPPLDAAPTPATLADVHLKPAHVRPHHGQLFLDLIGDARFVDRTAARRTARGQRHVNRFVNVCRRLSMSVAAVPAACPATRHVRLRGGGAFREGRSLPLRRPPREIEFLLQPLVLAPQPRILTLDSLALLAFPIPVMLRALSTFTPLTLALILAALGHAAFMADSRK
jgi:hypothetical protein